MISNQCQWDNPEDGRCRSSGALWVLDLWLCPRHSLQTITIRETVIAERLGHIVERLAVVTRRGRA